MGAVAWGYDVVVIGGGHAGIEASLVCARLGKATLLVTMDSRATGRMSCNPAIGGLAKGHLVREIDALGGEMARIIDATGIQFRMLNRSKGPAVWSPRAQADRKLYAEEAQRIIASQENLTVYEGMVIDIIRISGRAAGVRLLSGEEIATKAVVVTAGTFLNGLIHIGLRNFPAGRIDEPAATGLTDSLMAAGHSAIRFKTGTPPRIDGNTVDWDATSAQPGDDPPFPFSYRTERIEREQVDCYLTYTNENTHKSILSGLDRSPLYSGVIKSLGPRYCPSVETKIVRFPDKGRHQIFLEPEGLDTDEIYVNGFATSLPEDIQEKAIQSIRGLEKAIIKRYGYAIEYDAFPPTELKPTLESRFLPGVYLAGQICGTSGYEEAAGQGLIAGINAVLAIDGKQSFILERSEAYIGVMIDDLVTRGVDEPYRMFTSRAEYRLVLRQDNADERLMKYGRELGLISEGIYERMVSRRKVVDEIILRAKSRRVRPEEINPILQESGSPSIERVESLYQILKRPDVNVRRFVRFFEGIEGLHASEADSIIPKVEMESRYEGYIKRQEDQISKFRKWEHALIPADIEYREVDSLKAEVVEKLNKFRPRSIGQASRIPGITPAAISLLLIFMKRRGWLN